MNFGYIAKKFSNALGKLYNLPDQIYLTSGISVDRY